MKKQTPSAASEPPSKIDVRKALERLTPEDRKRAVEERKRELERRAPKTLQVWPEND